MFEFIRKSPFGFAITVAALILGFSPEAREATRKLVVRGTGAVLDLVDEARRSASALPHPPEHDSNR